MSGVPVTETVATHWGGSRPHPTTNIAPKHLSQEEMATKTLHFYNVQMP